MTALAFVFSTPAVRGQPAAAADSAAVQLPDRDGERKGCGDQRAEGACLLSRGRRQVRLLRRTHERMHPSFGGSCILSVTCSSPAVSPLFLGVSALSSSLIFCLSLSDRARFTVSHTCTCLVLTYIPAVAHCFFGGGFPAWQICKLTDCRFSLADCYHWVLTWGKQEYWAKKKKSRFF